MQKFDVLQTSAEVRAVSVRFSAQRRRRDIQQRRKQAQPKQSALPIASPDALAARGQQRQQRPADRARRAARAARPHPAEPKPLADQQHDQLARPSQRAKRSARRMRPSLLVRGKEKDVERQRQRRRAEGEERAEQPDQRAPSAGLSSRDRRGAARSVCDQRAEIERRAAR